MNDEIQNKREQALRDALNCKEKWYVIARTMQDPFREGIEFCSLVRKVMNYDYIDSFDQFNDSDKITASSISLEKVENFYELDRSHVKAQANMTQIETERFVNNILSESYIERLTLSHAFEKIEEEELNVGNLIISSEEISKIKNHPGFDACGDRALIKTGYLGQLWNASVRFVSPKLLIGYNCILLPEHRHVGKAIFSNLSYSIDYGKKTINMYEHMNLPSIDNALIIRIEE